MGFYQYENVDEMQIRIDFTVPKTSKQLKNIGEVLEINKWKHYDNENETREWYNNEGLSFFIENNLFQIDKACDFIERGLKLLQSFR